MGFGFLMMSLMLLGAAVVLILLIVLVWALIRWLNQRQVVPSRTDRSAALDERTPLEILQQRYARGEIDQHTFEQMREQLQSTSAPRSSQRFEAR